MPESFVHLRVYSEYSVKDGAARLSEGGVVSRAAELEMPALGISDIGNMFGCVKFFQSCRRQGIKPVLGCEMPVEEERELSHMLLLCASEEGHLSMNTLLSRAYEENGGSLKAEWILEGNAGLLALSGGRRGDIGRAIAARDAKTATARAGRWREAFGDRFYAEVWRAEEDDGGFAAAVTNIAAQADIPVVATHPVQCARKDDAHMLAMRRCISHNRQLSDQPPPFADPPHLLSGEEMMRRFADMPEALENSSEIARRCSYAYRFGETHLPVMAAGTDKDSSQTLARLAAEGLQERGVPAGDEERYGERLRYELGVIGEMNYSDYFLIVADFVGWAKQEGIPVGPGRGSGSASLVAYALRITDMDPLKYGLLFERFLNPERVSLPDFDIDFCEEGRDRVIEYVRQKHGADRVAQIVTFGQIGARSAVRDIARVTGESYGFGDRVAKLIPGAPNMTIERALEETEDLKAEMKNSEEVRNLVEKAQQVEGLPRNIGTHAGGVLIAPSPIAEFCPLYAAEDTEGLVSQMDMTDVEKIGLVKFDFLGLRTLTLLHHAEQMLKERGDAPADFSLDNIPLDDPQVFALYARGDTMGVFQCESQGMREWMRRLKPDRFEEIVALMALYRPGPLNSGMVDSYVKRKHGEEEVSYPHESLQSCLQETYGVWVYQEQVMETARVLAGYSLGGADLLRRAMGKKMSEEMDRERGRFVEGASQKIPKDLAEKLFDTITEFAKYGFNKAHAAAYALVSYRTAYLKTHYPAALYAAVMTASAGDSDRLKKLADSAKEAGVKLLPPDVNRGGSQFGLSEQGEITYGMAAIKGVGKWLVEEIVKERDEVGARPFSDMIDFCRRMGPGSGGRMLARGGAISLAKAGAMDGLYDSRASMCATIPMAMEEGRAVGLFGEGTYSMRDAPPWSEHEKLLKEIEALGFPMSGSFYSLHQKFLQSAGLQGKLADVREEGNFRVAGVLSEVQSPRILRQRNERVLVLEDHSKTDFEVVASDSLLDSIKKLRTGVDLVIVEGRGGRRLRATKVWTLDEFAAESRRMVISCGDSASVQAMVRNLEKCKARDGGCEVRVAYEDARLRCDLSLGRAWRPNETLWETLQGLDGVATVKFSGAN